MEKRALFIIVPFGKTKIEVILNTKRGNKMAKRKAEVNAAGKHNQTPKRNLAESEFSAEFASGEETMKHANRNSNKGRKGKN